MPDTFDSSPRISKRRKLTAQNSQHSPTEISRSEPSSVLRNVSNTLTGLSRRFFQVKKGKEQPKQHDSAYGSKEDSLIGEEGLEESHGTEPSDDEAEKAVTLIEVRDESVEASLESLERPKRPSRTDRLLAHPASEDGRLGGGDKIITEKASRKRKSSGEGSQSLPLIEGLTREPEDTSNMAFDANGRAREQEIQKTLNRDGSVEADEGAVVVQPRSSGRDRRRPRRFSIEPVPIETTKPPQPKSILTPSKRIKASTRKSVIFEDEEKDLEKRLGFRDIDTSVKKPKKGKRTCAKKPAEIVPNPSPTTEDAFNMEFQQDIDMGDISDLGVEDTFRLEEAPIVEIPLVLDPMEQTSMSQPESDSTGLESIKKTVISRLSLRSSQPSSLAHLQAQYHTLHTLLKSTVASGESNSLLLLGSRGSGKTLLIENVLKELSLQHESEFHIVRLNGFIQTDDKLALREIWRQLGRERQVDEEETAEVTSYADTLASLLGLLAHPDEILEPQAMDVEGRIAKSIIFILDEFDLFTTHSRQTLLYNLFDIAQARKAPIAVLGCSTRMDVVECLEKRVKSRFSHRWLHVPRLHTLADWEVHLQKTLSVEESGGLVQRSREEQEWGKGWNEYIKHTLIPSPAIQSLIQQVFHTTKSFSDLLTLLYVPIATATIDHTSSDGFDQFQLLLPPDSLTTSLLPSLSTLHLTLLTAAARLESIHALPCVNFAVTYSHLAELVTRAKLQQQNAASAAVRLWGRDVARRAWEELVRWEILVPVAGGIDGSTTGGGGKKDDGGAVATDGGGGGGWAETKMCRVDVGLEDVGWAVQKKALEEPTALGGMTEVLGKWCREI